MRLGDVTASGSWGGPGEGGPSGVTQPGAAASPVRSFNLQKPRDTEKNWVFYSNPPNIFNSDIFLQNINLSWCINDDIEVQRVEP